MASGNGSGSGTQFHCPAVSAPEVTTLPGISVPDPWLVIFHSANFCAAVGCPDGHTHHQYPSNHMPPAVTSNWTPARNGPS